MTSLLKHPVSYKPVLEVLGFRKPPLGCNRELTVTQYFHICEKEQWTSTLVKEIRYRIVYLSWEIFFKIDGEKCFKCSSAREKYSSAEGCYEKQRIKLLRENPLPHSIEHPSNYCTHVAWSGSHPFRIRAFLTCKTQPYDRA